MRFSNVISSTRILGPRATASKARARLRPTPPSFAYLIEHVLRDARVLEFGGPSGIFRSDGDVPSYRLCATVDNVNYQGETLWETNLADEGPFSPEGKLLGKQFLTEATAPGSREPYDVITSSHMIEHTSNPIGALRAWREVCVPDGWLLLVLPHRDATFDHRRPLTTLEHLLSDADAQMPESDTTHFAEILELHDVEMDEALTDRAALSARLEENVLHRGAHHHVFSARTCAQMVNAAGWDTVCVEARWPMNIILVARNRAPGTLSDAVQLKSPFRADR